VADGGDGGDVDVVGVIEDSALVEEAFEAGGVFGAEAEEVVVAELVDDEGEDKFGFTGRGEGWSGEGCRDKREGEADGGEGGQTGLHAGSIIAGGVFTGCENVVI